jgi:hypothetical protein
MFSNFSIIGDKNFFHEIKITLQKEFRAQRDHKKHYMKLEKIHCSKILMED